MSTSDDAQVLERANFSVAYLKEPGAKLAQWTEFDGIITSVTVAYDVPSISISSNLGRLWGPFNAWVSLEDLLKSSLGWHWQVERNIPDEPPAPGQATTGSWQSQAPASANRSAFASQAIRSVRPMFLDEAKVDLVLYEREGLWVGGFDAHARDSVQSFVLKGSVSSPPSSLTLAPPPDQKI